MNRRFFLLAAPAIVVAPSTAVTTPEVPWNIEAVWIGDRLVSHQELVERGWRWEPDQRCWSHWA